MKKSAIVFIVIAMFGFTNSLSAQNFSIGVKGGVNIPNLTAGGTLNPLNEGYESRLGATYGAFGEYRLSKHFSVSLGVEYSSQGGQKDKFQAFVPTGDLVALAAMYQAPLLYADFKSEARLNYLLVPVMARFSWNFFKKLPVKVYAAVGPFAGFLLNSTQITSGSSLVYADAGQTIALPLPAIPFDATTDIKDQLHSFNFGVNCLVGLAYNFSLKSSIFVEGGGNYGFVPIQKVPENGKSFAGAGTLNFGYAHSF